MKLSNALRLIILAFAIVFITASPALGLINNSTLNSQTLLINEVMENLVLVALFITVFFFIGLSNFGNAITVGAASIMVSIMVLFVMKVFNFM